MRRTEGSRLLLAHPRVRIMALCKVPKGTVSRWCSGMYRPADEHRATLVALGIPLDAWTRPPRREVSPTDAAHVPQGI